MVPMTGFTAEVEDFDGIVRYTLRNNAGMVVKVTNYGAIITSRSVPDRHGRLADVALGYDRVEDYMNAVEKPYFGAIVGRYANRIAHGTFVIGEYKRITRQEQRRKPPPRRNRGIRQGRLGREVARIGKMRSS